MALLLAQHQLPSVKFVLWVHTPQVKDLLISVSVSAKKAFIMMIVLGHKELALFVLLHRTLTLLALLHA